MQSMRYACRSLRICPCCLEAQLSVLRIVIHMDEIMQDTRMVGMTGVHVLKEFGRPALLLKSPGTFRDGTQDGQSIKQRGFVIRIFGVYGCHCVSVLRIARRLRSGTSVFIENGQCTEIEFFTRRGL